MGLDSIKNGVDAMLLIFNKEWEHDSIYLLINDQIFQEKNNHFYSIKGDFLNIFNDFWWRWYSFSFSREFFLFEKYVSVDDIYQKLLLKKKESLIFDNFYCLPREVMNFWKTNGFVLGMEKKTLSEFLENQDNNYELREKRFFDYFWQHMLDSTECKRIEEYKESLSVIIPYYNSKESIMFVLDALEKQENIDFDLMEVIIVDDCSDLELVIDKNYSFKLMIMRNKRRNGALMGRRIWAKVAQNNILVFLDSDIILSPNYLYEHMLRNILIHNWVFVSFKKNISLINYLHNNYNFFTDFSDFRLKKNVDPEKEPRLWIETKTFWPLNESNFFKDFWYWRKIGPYSLQNMLVGNNFSCRRENYLKIKAYSKEFQGWGMEDVYIGAKMIAWGIKIIPVLSCSVLHIDHLPRSLSLDQKFSELINNIKIYEKKLNELVEIF